MAHTGREAKSRPEGESVVVGPPSSFPQASLSPSLAPEALGREVKSRGDTLAFSFLPRVIIPPD